MASQCEFYQIFREKLIPFIFKFFQKIKEKETLPNSFNEFSHSPDTKARQRCYKKRNYRPIPLLNIEVKILNIIGSLAYGVKFTTERTAKWRLKSESECCIRGNGREGRQPRGSEECRDSIPIMSV